MKRKEIILNTVQLVTTLEEAGADLNEIFSAFYEVADKGFERQRAREAEAKVARVTTEATARLGNTTGE